MVRSIHWMAVALLVIAASAWSTRVAEAQVYSTYYAPSYATPVTSYYAPAYARPVTRYYAPARAYTAYYAPPVAAVPAATVVRVRRPLLRPWTTVVRQRTVPVAPAVVVPRASYYWPY